MCIIIPNNVSFPDFKIHLSCYNYQLQNDGLHSDCYRLYGQITQMTSSHCP